MPNKRTEGNFWITRNHGFLSNSFDQLSSSAVFVRCQFSRSLCFSLGSGRSSFRLNASLICFASLLSQLEWQKLAKIATQVFVCRFCQFHDKCVVFVRNCKIVNSIQYKIQYIPCNRALIAKETLFLT